MLLNLRKILLVAAALAATACVSSSDYEHLERQDQLHQLETGNLQKRLDAAVAELNKQRATAAELDKQLATATLTIEQKDAALSDLEGQLRAKVTATSILEGKLAKVREALNGNSLAKSAVRKALLMDLLPAVAPPVAVEEAPAAEAAPAGVTH